MKEDDKLINAIIDLGTGMKALRDEMKGMRKDMNSQFGELNHRVEKLEKQQARTNMELGEIRLTFMQHSDTIQKVQLLEKRVYKLEQKNIH
jgi:Sec-independent protein translocase protein TatA